MYTSSYMLELGPTNVFPKSSIWSRRPACL